MQQQRVQASFVARTIHSFGLYFFFNVQPVYYRMPARGGGGEGGLGTFTYVRVYSIK
jgi:hypothetical protein